MAVVGIEEAGDDELRLMQPLTYLFLAFLAKG
jgi:hypothetical protein